MAKGLLLVLMINLAAMSAYGANVCNTLRECRLLMVQLSASLAAVDAKIKDLKPKPQFSEIARTADGKILYLSQVAAIKYCNSQGQHLPSARELAQLAESMGAEGIYEEPRNDDWEWTRKVDVKNVDGTRDVFYYRTEGYRLPIRSDFYYEKIWSSSVETFGLWSIYLYGGGAELGAARSDEALAVRCVRGYL